jgi:hypothetical protein
VKATITKVTVVKLSPTLSQLTYEVTIDPLPGKLPQANYISQRLAERGPTYSGNPSRTIGFLRPLGGGGAADAGRGAGAGEAGIAASRIESDKLRVDDNATVPADREILDCKNLKAGLARQGQPPPAELIKKLIRCALSSIGLQ